MGPRMRKERHSPSSTRHASEAREYIEHELQCNPALSQDRRTILLLAQKFVGQLSAPGLHRQETAAGNVEVEDNLPPPTLTPELLHMMLPSEWAMGSKDSDIPTYSDRS